MTKAIILNTINDVLCLTNDKDLMKNLDQYHLFSTHLSVDVYLKHKYNIECECLSKFLSSEDASANVKLSAELAGNFVASLDDYYSDELNKKSGFKDIRFFKGLYEYVSYYWFNTAINLVWAIERAVKKHNLKEVLFYSKSLDNFFNTSITWEIVIKELMNNANVEFIKKESKTTGKDAVYADKNFKEYGKYCLRRAFDFYSLIKKKMNLFIKRKKTAVLLYDPLYDLAFLHKDLKKYNTLYYKIDEKIPFAVKVLKKEKSDLAIDKAFNFDEKVKYPEIKNLLMRIVKEDFNKKIPDYIESLKILDEIVKKYNIKLGAWGTSPVRGLKALVFEYLLANNIPVLGCQQGGPCGNRHNHDVYIADAARCNHYITYGYNKEDLAKTYPHEEFNFSIYDFGSVRINNIMMSSRKNTKKKKIDILFPITFTSSMLDAGVIMEKPDTLTENQIKLLNYLNTLKGYSVVIKPLINSDYENLAVMPILEKMQNLKVVNNITLDKAFRIYEPRCVLIEVASTPLYEALGLDTEIFLLSDSVRPIEEAALEKLKKRVHYSEKVDEIISNIDLFLNTKLEKKRDDSFYNQYIYKDKTPKNILQAIDNIIQFGNEKVGLN